MKMKLFVVGLLAISLVAGLRNLVVAEGYSYDIDSTITIDDQLASRVETTVRATAGTGASVPNSISLPRHGERITELRAFDGDDQAVTIEENDQGLVLRLNSFQGRDADDWAVTISYNSTTGLGIGRSSLIMLPPFSYDTLNVASESITIVSSAELGSFVTRGSAPSDSTTTGGNFVNTWTNSKGPILDSVGLLYGDNALAELSFAKALQNDSLWWQTLSVVLPPDTNQQKVFINSIQPRPTSVRLDVDGNVILDYRVGPRGKVDVAAELLVSVNSYTYSLDSTLLVNDIDTIIKDRYTTLNDVWADTSLSFDNVDATPAIEVVETIYDQIAREYSRSQGDTPYESAVNRSNALIGELRANQIPARLVIGAAFGDGSRAFAAPRAHAWAEVFVPDIGWVTLDVNFEQNGDYFGVTDVQRVALALRGFDPEFPPENLADFVISYSDREAPDTPDMKPVVTARKHMILPGLSLDSTTIEMPSGVIVDDAGLLVGGDNVIALGSLAPFQSVTLRSASLLADAFTSESVQYGVFDASGSLSDGSVLVQTTMTVSYIPMIILFITSIFGYFMYKFVWPRWHERKSEKRRQKSKSSKKKSKGLKVGTDTAGGDIENVDMLAALDLPDDEDEKVEPPRPDDEDEKVEPPHPDDDVDEKMEIPDDLVDDEQPDEPEMEDDEPLDDAATTNEADLPKMKMAARPEPTENSVAAEGVTALKPKAPKPKAPGTISLEKAHETTPDEIRREMKRKRPPLIQ